MRYFLEFRSARPRDNAGCWSDAGMPPAGRAYRDAGDRQTIRQAAPPRPYVRRTSPRRDRPIAPTTPRSWVISNIASDKSRPAAHRAGRGLRLHGHVECGGRLVGDQQLRAGRRQPSRSSRADACRRRAGADSHRPAAGSGMRDPIEHLDRALAGLSRRQSAMKPQSPRRSACQSVMNGIERCHRAPERSSQCRGRGARAWHGRTGPLNRPGKVDRSRC